MEADSKLCQLCNVHVLLKCFDIHKRACEKKHKKASSKAICSLKMEQILDLIPCSQCGQMVSFSVYGIHIEECVGRQLAKCKQCKLLYPTFLMQEHMKVCTTFNQEVLSPQKAVKIYEEEANIENYLDQLLLQDDDEMEEMIMQLAAEAKKQDQPLSLTDINKMPKTFTLKVQECSICYCNLPNGSQVLKLRCPHVYHLRCLTAWLQKNPHCPLCRRYVLK